MRAFQSGAEGGIQELSAVQGFTRQTSQYTTNPSGSWGGQASFGYNASMSNSQQIGFQYDVNMPSDTKMFYKADIKITTLPANSSMTFIPFTFQGVSGPAARAVMWWNGTDIKIQPYINGALVDAPSNLGVGLNTWFRLEAMIDSNTDDGTEVLEVRINGTPILLNDTNTFTDKTYVMGSTYVYNNTGSGQDCGIYIDNIAINTSTGTVNNSWIGEEYIIPLPPVSAGDSNATTGSYGNISGIPYASSYTSASSRIELDDATTEAWYGIKNPLDYMQSYDQITALAVKAMVRSESSTAAYQVGIKSVSGGTTLLTTQHDAPPVSYTPPAVDGATLISETDPTSGGIWHVTGEKSLQQSQIGVLSKTNNDLWCASLTIMVAYKAGTAPAPDNHGMMGIIW